MFSNYQETIDFLFSQLPVFQNQGKTAYKANLDNTIALDTHFNHPHKNYKTIHIAGTNGKGSVSHMIASVLQEAGFKVGLYTSPHLKDFRERIRINGDKVSEEYVVDFVNNNLSIITELKPSFFEITVAMAFKYFKDEGVDFAVIETGLGGRLDSTNIITPEISAITNISLDHTQFLGNTRKQIAGEKAGIIKEEVSIVIGQFDEEIASVFINKSNECNSPLFHSEEIKACWNDEIITIDEVVEFIPDLKGKYQLFNYRLAYGVVKKLSVEIKNETIIKGFSSVIENTGLMGRWQILNHNPLIVCDTAHNDAGVKEVVMQLKKLGKKLKIVWGMVSDKDIDAIIKLLPEKAEYYLCQPQIKRALSVEELAGSFKKQKLTFTSYKTVEEAYLSAKQNQTEEVLFIGGSTFVVSEIL